MPDQFPRRLSSAAACAIAAARALDAVDAWISRLTDNEIEDVLRRLQARQEWRAASLWKEGKK